MFASLLIASLCLQLSHSFNHNYVTINKQPSIDKLNRALDEFDEIVFIRKKAFISFTESVVTNDTPANKLSHKCRKALLTISDGLRKRKTFAYQFLEANSRDHRITHGYASSLRDQCVSISHEHFTGKHCVITARLPSKSVIKPSLQLLSPIQLNATRNETVFEHYTEYFEHFEQDGIDFSVCVPSACSRHELVNIANQCECKFHCTYFVRTT